MQPDVKRMYAFFLVVEGLICMIKNSFGNNNSIRVEKAPKMGSLCVWSLGLLVSLMLPVDCASFLCVAVNFPQRFSALMRDNLLHRDSH